MFEAHVDDGARLRRSWWPHVVVFGLLVSVAVTAPGVTPNVARRAPLLPAARTVRAADLTVCASGCAHTDLQGALDVAADGDRILVGAGVYAGTAVVRTSVVIEGAGMRETILDGARDGRPLTVDAGAVATVSGLTITRGLAPLAGPAAGGGGGIHNAGSLTLSAVAVNDNEATSGGGGGIHNTGSLRVVDSELRGNRARDGGSAVYTVSPGTLTEVLRTEVTQNLDLDTSTTDLRGGAIHAKVGLVRIEDALVADNEGTYTGGGVQLAGSGAHLELVRSTVRGNVATNGAGLDLRSSGSATITDSTIGPGNVAAGGVGGGIRIGTTTDAVVVNSTISGNRALAGGGVHQGGVATLRHTTVVDNEATYGGGVYATPGSIARRVSNENSVIAGNRAEIEGPDCWGLHDTVGASFVGDVTGCGIPEVDLDSGVVRTGAPLLGALADHGGPTWTHLPADGSPLIDDAGPSIVDADQRGLPRPSGGGPDLGSVEVQITVDPDPDPDPDPDEPDPSDDPGAPDGGFGPIEAVTDLTWTDALPFALLDRATSAGQVVVVASAGSAQQQRRLLAPGQSTLLDVDQDGVSDLRATATVVLEPDAVVPTVGLTVVRLTTPGPADVEVIAGIPADALDPSGRGTYLVTGFRTLAADGSPGGTMPDQIETRFAAEDALALDQRLRWAANTDGPSGPVLFLLGGVEGSTAIGAEAATVWSMSVDPVPSAITLDLATVFGGPVGEPSIGADDVEVGVDLTWVAPSDEPRPVVAFGHGARSRSARDAVEHRTRLVVDTMAPTTTLGLRLDPAGSGNDEAAVRLDGGTSAEPIAEVAVEHRRAGGLEIRGGFRDVDDTVTMSVGGDGSVRIGDGGSTSTRLFLELHQPGRDLFGGATATPVDRLHASYRDRTDAVVVEAGTLLAPDRITVTSADLAGGELVVVATNDATDDLTDLRLPDAWPAAPPRTWSFDRLGGSNAHTRVALVDDGERATIALHALRAGGISVDLDPVVLSQTVALSTASSQSPLEIDVQAASGTPVGGAAGTTVECRATLRAGAHSFVIEPMVRYGYDGPAAMTFVDCAAERGDRRNEVRATRVPRRTSIDVADLAERSGAFEILVEDPDDPTATLNGLVLVEVAASADDRSSLLPTGVLGRPVRFVRLAGTGIPSGRAEWRTDDGSVTDPGTDVALRTDGAERAFELLSFVIASVERPIDEDVPRPPTSIASGIPGPTTSSSGMLVWDLRDVALVSGRARHAARVELRHDGTDASIDGTVVARSAHLLTTQLLTDRGSTLAPGVGGSGGCSLQQPEGTTTVALAADRLVSVGTNAATGFDRLRCVVDLDGGPLAPVVRADLDALDLPRVVTIGVGPDGSVDLLTAGTTGTGDRIGSITVRLVDRSGQGMSGLDLLGRPAASVALRLDDVAGLGFRPRASQQTDVDVLLYAVGDPVGRVAAVVSTDATASFPSTDGIQLRDRASGSATTASIAFSSFRRTTLRLTAADAGATPGADLEVTHESPDPWTAEVDLTPESPLVDEPVWFRARIVDPPGALRLRSDLARKVRVDADRPIGQVDIRGRVGAGADAVSVDAVLESVPAMVALDLDGVVRVGGESVVVSTDTLGTIDAVVRSASGLAGTATDRVRIRAEDVPRLLRVDLRDTDDAGTSVTTASFGSNARFGRVLIEASASALPPGGDQFGLPFRNVMFQLADVPRDVSVEVRTDDDTDRLEVHVDTGGDAIGRVEVQGSNVAPPDDAPGRPDQALAAVDRGASLARFAEPMLGVVSRGAVATKVDDGYWDAATRQRWNDLDGVGVPLQITTVTSPGAPDGVSDGERTFAAQDHVVLTGMPADGAVDLGRLELVSVALSDVSEVSIAVGGDGEQSVRLARGAASPSGLYIGLDAQGRPRYPGARDPGGADTSDDPDVAVSPDDVGRWFPLVEQGGPYRYRPLAGIAELRPETLAIVTPPSRGSATVSDGIVSYTTPDGVVGGDAMVLEACDAEDRCARWWYRLQIEEVHRRVTAVHLVAPPRVLEVVLGRRDHGAAPSDVVGETDGDVVSTGPLDEFRISATGAIGPIEVYDGPAAPLGSAPDAEDPAARGNTELVRVRAALAGSELVVDLRGAKPGWDGRYAIDSDALFQAVGVVGDGYERTAFWLAAEDFDLEFRLQGSLLDAVTPVVAARYTGIGDCEDWFDTGCTLLARVQVDVNGIGDRTGSRATGAVARYELVDLHPEAGTGRAFVPRYTVGFGGLERLGIRLDVEWDTFCGICLWPLDIEWDVVQLVSSFRAGFWDQGFDICVTTISKFCVELDEPDYVEGDPWSISTATLLLLPGRTLPPSPTPANAPPLALTTDIVVGGDTVRVVLPAGTNVYQVLLYSSPVELAVGQIGPGDPMFVDVVLPEDLSPGTHTLVLRALVGDEYVVSHATLTVADPDAPSTDPVFSPPRATDPPQTPTGLLPATGGGPFPLVLLALVLIALGGVLGRLRRTG